MADGFDSQGDAEQHPNLECMTAAPERDVPRTNRTQGHNSGSEGIGQKQPDRGVSNKLEVIDEEYNCRESGEENDPRKLA